MQETGAVAYYRWGIANIGISGCDLHVRSIMEALANFQPCAFCQLPVPRADEYAIKGSDEKAPHSYCHPECWDAAAGSESSADTGGDR